MENTTGGTVLLYKLSADNGSNASPSSKGHGSFRIPTWLLVILFFRIVPGDMPINGFTVILAVIMDAVIWTRLIS